MLDSRETATRPLRVFFYELVEQYYQTHHEALEALATIGLPTHKLHRVCASLDEVLAYIEKEDTPRSLTYQLDLLRSVGFSAVEVLHKRGCFAAFGAVRA